MSYQLIALDLDGTLLTDDKAITAKTLALLERLRDEGVYIAICTGRSALSVRPLLQDNPFASHFITDNGGTVQEIATDRMLYTSTIPRSFLETMKQVIQTYDVLCDVTTEDHVYVEGLTEQIVEMYREYLIEPTASDDLQHIPQDPMKFTIAGESSILDDLVPHLVTQYGDDLKVVRSGEHFIDVMKVGTTKGKALKMLADHLQLQAENVLAIGNYYNDLEMLQYAGLGIAMDNSPDDLKAIADEVTLSNNDDGVRVALEKWLVSNRVVRR